MHDFNVKIIKTIIVVFIIAIILITLQGITVLKDNYYWRNQYFVMQWDYLKTEVAFAQYKYGGLLNWIFSEKQNLSSNSSTEKAQSVPILLYHGVIEDPNWKPDDVSIRLSDFQNQLFALKKAGYETIKLNDYLAFIKGQKELPKKSFMITFDDARSDSYYPVEPILKTLDYSAVMNVITGRSLSPQGSHNTFHLSKTELAKMVESGRWEMASHTQNGHGYEKIDPNEKEGHFLSNRKWLADKNRLETAAEFKKRIYDDLLKSKNDLEKQLGVKVLAFAYPFGDFGQASENFPESRNIIIDVAKSIFPLSFVQAGSSDFTTNYPENSFLAKRINVSSQISYQELLKIFENNENKSINFSDDFSQDKGWVKSWGSVKIGKESLMIGDSQEEDSGLVFLSGSYPWKDYFVQVKVVLLKGNAFALSARYQDENNYVSCDFSDNHVSVTQRLAGKDMPDIEVPSPANLIIGKEAIVGIQVKGDQASCYINGQPVVNGPIDDKLDNGGISIKIWDTIERGSTLLVKSVKVGSDPASLIK